MLSIYIDAITLVWALAVLVMYANWATIDPKFVSITGLVATILYLFAQTGWTAAFLSGFDWGRVFNNYIWFVFNGTVFAILTFLWIKWEKGK